MGSVNAAQRPGATGPAPSNVHHSQPLPKTAHPLHVTIGNLGTPGHERGQTPTTCFKTTLRLREERPAAHFSREVPPTAAKHLPDQNENGWADHAHREGYTHGYSFPHCGY